MDFAIARSPTWGWLLSAFGASAKRSVVRMEDDALDVEFGSFHQRISYSDIQSASVVARRLSGWRYSIGWRTNLAGTVALLGAAENVVGLELSKPFAAKLVPLFPKVSCHTLNISLEAPDAFVIALRSKLTAHA
jgi:hypothetical protein